MVWHRELVDQSELFLEELKEERLKPADSLDQCAPQMEKFFVDFSTRERQNKLIEEINLALPGITAGEYGYCEITGDNIGLKRLEARPVAMRCIEAQGHFERMVNARARPVSV